MELKVAKKLAQRVKDNLRINGVKLRAKIVGSIRRKEQNIGDIDILVVCDGKVDQVSIKGMKIKWTSHGQQRWIGSYENIQIDIFICKKVEYPVALFALTGPKSYNIRIRKYAKDRGYLLNHRHLLFHGKAITIKKERDITDTLGTHYYLPDKRK